MEKEWDVINILRHYRHDLLNHIQLINGYLSMGKTDKVKGLIDELVRQAKNESQLSNLNMPRFAEKLLTFNWEGHAFCQSFEVLSKTEDWSEQDELLLSFYKDMTRLFNDHVTLGEDQHLFIMINDIEEKVVILDFQGLLTIDSSWETQINRIKKTYNKHIGKFECHQSECYVTFFPEH